MSRLKYKVGNRVKIKSLDWYNKHKDKTGYICMGTESFVPEMSQYCGNILTIKFVEEELKYYLVEECAFAWKDEMIEGMAEEIEIAQDAKTFSEGYNQGYEDGQHDMNEWILPEGFEFTDENGNVINTTKIVLTKKKKQLPKTYEECCKVLSYKPDFYDADKILIYGYMADKLRSFQKLLVCRDAYWKLYGDEKGLGKPWEPDYNDLSNRMYGLYDELKYSIINPSQFLFPSKEMRDIFYENFRNLIEQCKKLQECD